MDFSDIATSQRKEVDRSEVRKRVESAIVKASNNEKNTMGTALFILVMILGVVAGYKWFGGAEDKIDPFRGMLKIPSQDDKSVTYYLKSHTKHGTYYITEHARISASSQGYSRTKIDCKESKYIDLAYNNTSFEELNDNLYSNTQWTDVVRGSSKSELLKTVCITLREQ